ncbi:MAG: DUF1028 domain-containing protein [Solirubrobacterales bacterium]|nr:DUF1028 domain-containing protein [Solirubrobacterales bacterium]
MAASTYSITAYDATAVEWGVAVQSKFLAIGALTPWARVGAGAIATQAFINVSYGRDGLSLLERGLSAQEVVERLTSADPGRDSRQLGVVDRDGASACFTGPACFEWAGHHRGDGYAVQGNTLVSGDTLTAMVERYEAGTGEPLARRLVESLAAAQNAGGDRRGQQAAAVLTVRAGAGYSGADVHVDLRVDDHPWPIEELRRLLDLQDLYFGETPAEHWLELDDELTAEVRQHLDRLGYAGGRVATDLEAWAGAENFEERVRGAKRIDPVVLAQLRKTSDTGGGEAAR